MSTYRICFVARNDFETKPGGDTVQWRIYEEAAKVAGYSIHKWFGDEPRPDADVYHAFNLDRPLEIYPKLRQVHAAGLPFVLSTIHHPNEWLENFRYQFPPSGTGGRLLYRSVLGRTVPRSEALKEAVRLVGQRRVSHLMDLYPSWSRRIRWLLERAERILLLSKREGDYIEKDFSIGLSSDQTVILPNWVEGVGEAQGSVPTLFERVKSPPVVVVGRIEARKNVLRICRLAERPIVFLGRTNPNETAFSQTFEEAIDSNDHVEWIRGVPREQLAGYYQHADYLLNASFVEVSPFVDIEALSFGCPVATTRYAVHHEFLPANTPQVDPYDDRNLVELLSDWNPESRDIFHATDKENCKKILLDVYRELCSVERKVSSQGEMWNLSRAEA